MLTKEERDDIINEFCSREQKQNKFLKKLKKLLTSKRTCDMISKLLATESKKNKKLLEKKFLTKSKQHDKISKLSETAKNIDN